MVFGKVKIIVVAPVIKRMVFKVVAAVRMYCFIVRERLLK